MNLFICLKTNNFNDINEFNGETFQFYNKTIFKFNKQDSRVHSRRF